MRRENLYRLLLIAIVVVGAATAVYLKPLNLGLDLRGGVHVVLQAEETPQLQVTDETMQRTLGVIERRVNAIGVAEPIIQRQGARRIIVELPGVQEQQEAIDLIGKTAVLEFRDPQGNVVLTGADLVSARLGRDQYGRPAVDIEFTPEAGRKFEELTGGLIGQLMPIVLDGEVISAPRVESRIPGGKAQITGQFTVEEARELAVLLQAGSLPVPLEMLEIRNVGPILGQESIDSSQQAAVIGIILVLLFMFLFYRLPGAIADVALAVYVLIVLAVMALLRATLTLPGIAGLILSVGMAVDANIIIFERIKDELRSGKRLRAAIDAGFTRAFRAIVDANVTTLITAAVLFYFGTGPIRGFAVTLSIGILTSMFTAIVVTRSLMSVVVDQDPDRFSRFFGVKEVAAS